MADSTRTPGPDALGLTDSVGVERATPQSETGLGLSDPAPSVNLEVSGVEHTRTPGPDALGLSDSVVVTLGTPQAETGLGITDPTPVAGVGGGGTNLSRTVTPDTLGLSELVEVEHTYTDGTYEAGMGLTDEATAAGPNTVTGDAPTDDFGVFDVGLILEYEELITDDVALSDFYVRQGGTGVLNIVIEAEHLNTTDALVALTPGKFFTAEGSATADGGTTSGGADGTSYTVGGSAIANGGSADFYGIPVDGTITTASAEAAASGRVSTFLLDGTEVESTITLTVGTDVQLSVEPTDRFYPTIINSRVSTFEVEPWRVIEGVPTKQARYLTSLTVTAEVGGHATEAAFLDPEDLPNPAPFRWLATDFVMPEWYPNNSSSGFAETRSWDDVRNQFTWLTMARRTWGQVLYNTLDLGQPVWVPYGTEDPVLVSTYSYWRNGGYVSNPAVAMDVGTSMGLLWAPVEYPSQITVIAILVPRTPAEGAYEILQASPNIRIVLNSDSTMDLLYADQVLSTTAITARTRPNEPIAVALSLSTADRRITLGVMDTMVRVTTTVAPGHLDLSALDWKLCADGASRLELLEVNMYTSTMSPSEISRALSSYDRVYGVTV